MEPFRNSNVFQKCRLCGIFGQHKREILQNQTIACGNNSHALNEKIFRCVGVWVEPDDESTKICENCSVKIVDILQFRELCAVTNSCLRKLKSLHNGDRLNSDVINQPNVTQELENVGYLFISSDAQNRFASIDPPVTNAYISRIDDETDSEMNETKANFKAQNRKGRLSGAIGDRECSAMNSSQTLCGDNESPVNIGVNQNDNESAEHGFSGANLSSAQNHSEEEIAVECESNGCDRAACISLSEDETDSKVVDTNANVQFRCTELFKSQRAMIRHVSSYHGRAVKKTYCCYLCKKTFTKKRDIQHHMTSVHTVLKRFKCSFAMCSQGFSYEVSLKRHINTIHVNNVALKCKMCSMIFYRKSELKLHLGSVHGEGTIYCCSLCKKTLLSQHSLQRHMDAIHTNSIRFQCSVKMCSKSFTTKQNLNVHTNAVHTKNTVFTCTKCTSKFYRKIALKTHMENLH